MRSTMLRTRGFSIVELMIAVTIGLLALALATRLVTGSESAKASALGTSDSMQNGMLAMFSISGDARQAGFGLNDPLLIGCDTIFTDKKKFTLAEAKRNTDSVHPLASAVIVSGGTGPDTISLYSGSSLAGTGTVRVLSNYIGGTSLNLDSPAFGFSLGDVVVVAPENSDGQCALAQISAAPDAKAATLTVAGGNYRYNSGELGRNFSGGLTRVFNLGPEASLSFHTWSVEDGFLKLRATDMDGSSENAATVADDIVSIKAQYGLDNRPAAAFNPRDGLNVGVWSNIMIDADGDTVVGGAGDYQRVAALRIAVVARSKRKEMKSTAGVCTATADAPKVFKDAAPLGITAVPVTVDVKVPGDPVDWHCYRYRVFETIVPLRNAQWRP